jgi:hypothetical protein
MFAIADCFQSVARKMRTELCTKQSKQTNKQLFVLFFAFAQFAERRQLLHVKKQLGVKLEICQIEFENKTLNKHREEKKRESFEMYL